MRLNIKAAVHTKEIPVRTLSNKMVGKIIKFYGNLVEHYNQYPRCIQLNKEKNKIDGYVL